MSKSKRFTVIAAMAAAVVGLGVLAQTSTAAAAAPSRPGSWYPTAVVEGGGPNSIVICAAAVPCPRPGAGALCSGGPSTPPSPYRA